MAEATITSKGQVTIPKKIREKLHLNPGDKLNFELGEGGTIKIRPTQKSILDRAGALSKYAKDEPVSVEEMNEAIKKAAVKRYKKSQ